MLIEPEWVSPEAGKLPFDPVNFPLIDPLGIYPNLGGLAVQSGLITLAMLILRSSGLRRRTAA